MARLHQIDSAVLEKVCQYFHHKLRCLSRGPEAALPEFPIAADEVLQLLMVCALTATRLWLRSDSSLSR